MRHLFSAVSVCIAVLAGLAPAVSAQNLVPDFRYLASRDTDFFGADLDALFDTDLASCVRACSANPACTAFTFNARSNACFPKSGVSDAQTYAGAISARKLPTEPGTAARAGALAAKLDFLGQADRARITRQAREVGLRHAAAGLDLNAVLDALRASAGDPVRASGWAGAAVSLVDRADLWTEYARQLLAITSQDDGVMRDNAARAVTAAANGYLRSDDPATGVSALATLARALERAGRGRDMISALRLAQDTQPRQENADALEAAVAKYGFRIVDSSVESDAAAPRICARFSEPLVKAGVDYETFVALPSQSLVVQPDDNQICVDGVVHGERYRLTFRRGLPAASGETLFRDVTLTHYVRDRSPSVRFPGRAYVLPRTADAGLPIQTVNAGTVDLVLRRVSDRNLVRSIRDGLFGRPLSYWQDQEFSSEIAEQVWSGTGTVDTELNRDMTTRLPIGAALAGQDPGIYALTARIPGADPYDDPGATQWFVLSDLGLSTMSGVDGLHVIVRGLGDAAPRVGVDLSLVSRSNRVLGSARTGTDGHALFDPGLIRGSGAAAPAIVVATLGNDDFSFLSLDDPAFDLSDRGVEGREPAGPVDVFMTTDRGAYRAGETINATVLARDGAAAAIQGLPLVAILSRPDGVEYRRKVSDGGMAGGHVFSMPVGPDAPRGTWRLEIRADPGGPALASASVLVEDFLPERIDFDLALPDAELRPGDSPELRIEARYLFGAPGSDLSVEGQVMVQPAGEVAQWPGFRFGRYDAETTAQASFFSGERTDAGGTARVVLDLPVTDAAGTPLEATVIARLADGSARPVERRLTAPVLPAGPVIGIRPMFDQVVPEGSQARFEIIGLSPDLTPQPMRIRWTLNRLETTYQWYQLYGNWNWEPTTRRTRVATGEADLGSEPLTLAQPVDWGRYELVAERIDGAYAGAAADFDAGWYAAADASATPDRLELSLDRDRYRPGDTAQLRIVPRDGGTALITVMSNRLIHRETIAVDAGETVIPLQVGEDWGTGAYVSATVIRPMDTATGRNPARALGIVHAGIEPVGRTLSVAIDVPETAEPRRSQTARVVVGGAPAGEPVWLTLAAVDLGILNLTGFPSPDPAGHYFGQQRLGIELRDVYGRLIDGMNGSSGSIRSGGDADAGLRMQSPPPTQDLMAAFSGPVRVGANGEALVDIDLPAFNGTVRLMAVAWSASALGQAEADMTVRDPVVVTASLPRLLAPGDNSRLRLDFAHADGPAGDFTLAVTADDGIGLGQVPDRFTLNSGDRVGMDIALVAGLPGDREIAVTLGTPDGRTLTQKLTLPIRSNDPPISRTRRFALAGGDSFLFSDDVFAGLKQGTGRAILSAGPLARFDAPGLLTQLDRYPYGCTEQVTSQAMPLLYLSAVAGAAGLGTAGDIDRRIDASVGRILSRQAPNGGFGLWRAESGDFWLDAYVSDFLSRARAEGHAVSDRAFTQAMDNLRNRINYAPDFDDGGQDIAYALMILAREGAASMGDLRYYADVKGDAFATPLAAAQIGAALAAYGDQTRADAMFARAARMIAGDTGDEPPYWRADYGTRLRDAAGVLALAREAGSAAVDADTLAGRLATDPGAMSTQEAAWTLLAANALIDTPEQSGLLVNGEPAEGALVEIRQAGIGGDVLNITAADGRQSDVTLTTIGVPDQPPPAGGTGYAISRTFYSMEGEPLETAELSVGQRFVTVLRVDPFQPTGARLMVNDPLAAGIEIDNPSLLRSGDVRALDWLDPTEATHAEFRSDRFLAAADIRDGNAVTLAYVARAVSPGDFHHPAALVEDMYRPRYRAWTDTGRVTVSE